MDSIPRKPADDIRLSMGAVSRRTCLNLRSTWIFVLAPIILLALPIAVPTQEARCAYVILLMLTYYLTEVIPIPVVSLIPLILLPLFEIVPPKDLSKMYMKEPVVSFLGSVMVAISLQRWGIPKRLALWVLLKVGTDIRRLLFSMMVTTSFLSLWINNSPTAVMMLPIAKSVATEYLKQFSMKKPIDKHELQINEDVIGNIRLEEENPENIEEDPVEGKTGDLDKEEEFEEMSKEKKNVMIMFILSIPWSCNLGGAGAIYGTSFNLLLKANLESEFEDPINITFVNWIAFSLPCSLIMLAFGWAWLQIYHLGWRSLFICRKKTLQNLQREANLKSIFKNHYRQLGPISFAQYAVVGHMTVLALCWLTMEPGFVPGWGSLLSKRFVSGYPMAILLTISTFVFPSEFPNFLRFWDKKEMAVPHTPAPALMDWKTLNEMMPWQTLLLTGGGMALAEGVKLSGLSVWIAGNLESLSDFPPYAIVIISVTFSTFATELMNGAALLSIVHPILANLAVLLRIHPLYVMFPVSIGVAYSFMLPTASGTNAITYSAGVLTIPDMAKPGLLMNFLGILVITLAINTWGTALFQLYEFPTWAGRNSTL